MSLILILVLSYFIYVFFFSRKSLFNLFFGSYKKPESEFKSAAKPKKEDKEKAELLKDGEYISFEEIDDSKEK